MRILADENFNNDIVRGLLRRKPDLNIVRIQDVGLSGSDDPTVLEWAACEERVLLTHDVSTITRYAYERINAGKGMPGVFEVSRKAPLETVMKTFFCWPSAVLKGNGKGKCGICPYDKYA